MSLARVACNVVFVARRFYRWHPVFPKDPEMDELMVIVDKLVQQGDKVRQMKASNAQKEVVYKEIERLLAIKTELKEKGEKSKKILKTAKGTKDHDPEQMMLREKTINKIIGVFKKHGAETIETPVFELTEILTEKYGEDSKLIFDISDFGGELLSLRYDLTVPFARYLAMNNIINFKRYQIAKVYRRDCPVMTKGRYREFLQCDFDVSGVYDPMVPDSECLKMICEILDSLNLGDYRIKVNHRQILDGIFAICGVPKKKFRTVCSSIDKLDKVPWEDVRKEIVEEKGIDGRIADEIGKYTQLSGDVSVLNKLKEGDLSKSKSAMEGIADVDLLLTYCGLLGCSDRVVVDISLARGLDYYTGVIFEAVFTEKMISDENGEPASVGSVAGGGRYDNLVGVFVPGNKSVPCVGFSIGVERLFTIMEAQLRSKKKKLRTTEVEVFVASAHRGLLQEKLKVCRELWDQGIKAEQMYKHKAKLLEQLHHCEDRKIPYAVLIGESEIEKGQVILRKIDTREELLIPRSEMGNIIKEKLALLTDESEFTVD